MVPKVLVGLIAAGISAAVVLVISVLVYLGCKLSRSRQLPLAPATEPDSCPQASIVTPGQKNRWHSLLAAWLRQVIRIKNQTGPDSMETTVEPTSSNDSPPRNGKKPSEPPITNLAIFQHADRKVVRFAGILKAAGKFSDKNIIGIGAFGTVYGGTVPDDWQVAIKRLHRSCRFLRHRQFAAEMNTIMEVRHENLVPFLGYCLVGDERLLIYARIPNGSLEASLRNQASTSQTAAIGWADRLEICLGSARGLAFLHHGFASSQVITHGDVKSSNVLLDEHMRPRVSDLGLARVIRRYETHVRTSVSGALEGYVPPEYPLKMKCTTKGDVYSFGVVVLEALTGRPAAGQAKEEGGGNLVGWVRWMAAHDREGEVFDPCLPEEDATGGLCRDQMARVLAVALECAADEPWKRPTMGRVVEQLETIKLMVHPEPQSPIRGVVLAQPT